MAAVKRPLITEKYSPGPGSRREGYEKTISGPCDMGWTATPAQVSASKAAHEAIVAGKTDQEVFEAAKKAYDARIKEHSNEVIPGAIGDRTFVPSDIALRERYLRACVSRHTGRPCQLSGQELLDVLLLIDEEVKPYQEWAKGVRALLGT